MWFKTDDDFEQSEKVHRSIKAGLALGNSCAPPALWHIAGVMCARRNTEGVVSEMLLDDACARLRITPDAAVPALVEAGLWHDAKTIRRCAPCAAAVGKLPRGAHYFHDWLEYQFTKHEAKLPEERRKRMRNKRLSRNTPLREQIVERDRGRCRYCGVRVDFRDRVGDNGGTYDHIDPAGGNDADNIVVACRLDNGRKSNRTPEEWVAEDGLWHPESNPNGGRVLIPLEGES